ncbi:MAG: glycosyltransferase [Flavobacterium sp.]|nr:glycosyltransferase [Flavobacterium sp.]
MKFAIFTHVTHNHQENKFWAYAPYVYEMNIWLKFVNEVTIVAPISLSQKTEIDAFYIHEKLNFKAVNQIYFLTLKTILKSIIYLPKILFTIFQEMQKADHIHLRCPGNIGLLACFVQILFPKKIKTAKYAGNWDPNSKQPISYGLQKWILSNTFLTKNMQVLVYGNWGNQSKNIKPFFTATYSEAEKKFLEQKKANEIINFLFVGTLNSGKRPLYAIQIVEKLLKQNQNISLDIYGDGILKTELQSYLKTQNLEKYIHLKGNQKKEVLKAAYINSHFIILPSKSEGWPKAIAEGMFWGCVPVATNVSCVKNMLDNEKRGLILSLDINRDIEKINYLIENINVFNEKSNLSSNWSRSYTTDFFESEIKKLLNPIN